MNSWLSFNFRDDRSIYETGLFLSNFRASPGTVGKDCDKRLHLITREISILHVFQREKLKFMIICIETSEQGYRATGKNAIARNLRFAVPRHWRVYVTHCTG